MKRTKKFKFLICTLIMLAVCLITVSIYAFKERNTYTITFNTDDRTMTIEYGEEFKEPAITASASHSFLGIHTHTVSLPVTANGEVDCKHLGTYVRTYQVNYKNQVKQLTFTVHVKDTKPPEITLVTNEDSFTSPVAQYEEEGFHATDNYDGDITEQVIRKEHDGLVDYEVNDSSGNHTKITRRIVYKDVVPPTITLKGSPKIFLPVGESYEEPGYSASDDVDGDLTGQVEVSGADSIDSSVENTYEIQYTVTDSWKNKTTVNRQVIVYQKQEHTSVNPGSKVVYLTFDDGPYKYTQQLLDILDKYNVKVTFFVTNQYPDYQNLIAEEAKRGHTVAIHSYSHDYGTVYASEAAYYDDLNKMNDIIRAQTGANSNIVRFPGGASNTISANYCSGIMSTLSASLTANGYFYCDWNVSSGDAGGTKDTNQVIANVINGISHNDISIVLQHDIKSFSVDAVEQIIVWGLENGYTFLPMTDTTPMVHQGIHN